MSRMTRQRFQRFDLGASGRTKLDVEHLGKLGPAALSSGQLWPAAATHGRLWPAVANPSQLWPIAGWL